MKYNQEVDKVLIHKTSKEINDNDINDGDTSDTDADNYTATRLESTSTNAALSKDTVLYKYDTFPSTRDQDLAALMTPFTSNNFTPIFAALFQAVTSSIMSTTMGPMAANLTSPSIKADTTNNMASNNVSISSSKFFELTFKIIISNYIF